VAQIIINTTADQDTAAQIAYNRFYGPPASPVPTLTLAQWVKAQLVAVLDGWVTQHDSEVRLTKAALYKLATPADQATIDAILSKYQ
jgi:hypothetical protein